MTRSSHASSSLKETAGTETTVDFHMTKVQEVVLMLPLVHLAAAVEEATLVPSEVILEALVVTQVLLVVHQILVLDLLHLGRHEDRC
jgi:hypothetical protein